MSNLASEEKAVLVSIFARCCLNGFYQKSIQTRIQNFVSLNIKILKPFILCRAFIFLYKNMYIKIKLVLITCIMHIVNKKKKDDMSLGYLVAEYHHCKLIY